jgi:hypothetical protein
MADSPVGRYFRASSLVSRPASLPTAELTKYPTSTNTFFATKRLFITALPGECPNRLKSDFLSVNREVPMSELQHQEATALQPIPQEAFDWYDEYAHGLIGV